MLVEKKGCCLLIFQQGRNEWSGVNGSNEYALANSDSVKHYFYNAVRSDMV